MSSWQMRALTRERIGRDDLSSLWVDYDSRVLAGVDLERTPQTINAFFDLGGILYRVQDRIRFGARPLCAVANDSIDPVLRETSYRGPILGDNAYSLCRKESSHDADSDAIWLAWIVNPYS
jgi:hypothetical protein